MLGNILTALLAAILSIFLMGAVNSAINASLRDLNRQSYKPAKSKDQIAAEQRRFLAAQPLAENEHCANGRRFRLTDKGWTEVEYGCITP